MKRLSFKESSRVSVGVELELQLIDPHSYSLASRAKELVRFIKVNNLQTHIKPEITQSMIEINSSVQISAPDLLKDLHGLKSLLLEMAEKCDILICGGGTHPFQKWSMQKIFPTKRYKKLARQYRYLSKCSTIFGQHVHVGCKNSDEAIYLTHALARYVPHFMAICASSPFFQGVDTGFYSARSTVLNSFPLSGVMPYLLSWDEFSNYYYTMKDLGIIESMKDFYWDIRPKPEFGTVEIRVCDTPLTLKKSVMVAAYIQTLALYLLEAKPFSMNQDVYFIYNYNRFQATRYGFLGHLIDPFTKHTRMIKEDILETIKKMEHYANQLNTMGYILQLTQDVAHEQTDAKILRQLLKQYNSFPKVVAEQCAIWAGEGI